MDFQPTPEQAALQETVSQILSSSDALARRPGAAIGPSSGIATTTVWEKLAQAGVLSMTFESDDSDDSDDDYAGLLESCLVSQKLGEAGALEPYVHVAVLLGHVLNRLPSSEARDDLKSRVGRGEQLASFAHQEPKRSDAWQTTRAFPLRERPGRWVLNGIKDPVLIWHPEDPLLVTADVGGRLAVFLVDPRDTRVSVDTRGRHDGGHVSSVQFENCLAIPVSDTEGDARSVVAEAVERAKVAYAFEALGGMQTAVQLTADYLTARRQFGARLSSFQALRFRAADMYVDLELSRSLAWWAALVLEDGGYGTRAAERSRHFTSRAARRIAQEAIQMHGAIGMTREYPLGNIVSRLLFIEQVFGGKYEEESWLAAVPAQNDPLDPFV